MTEEQYYCIEDTVFTKKKVALDSAKRDSLIKIFDEMSIDEANAFFAISTIILSSKYTITKPEDEHYFGDAIVNYYFVRKRITKKEIPYVDPPKIAIKKCHICQEIKQTITIENDDNKNFCSAICLAQYNSQVH